MTDSQRIYETWCQALGEAEEATRLSNHARFRDAATMFRAVAKQLDDLQDLLDQPTEIENA